MRLDWHWSSVESFQWLKNMRSGEPAFRMLERLGPRAAIASFCLYFNA